MNGSLPVLPEPKKGQLRDEPNGSYQSFEISYHTKSFQILTTLSLSIFDINVYLQLEWIAIEKYPSSYTTFYNSSFSLNFLFL